MQSDSFKEHTRLVNGVSAMRWIIPLTIALTGASYALFDRWSQQEHVLSALDVLQIIWFPGLVVPLFVLVVLTWIARVARAAALEHRRLSKEAQRQTLHLETANFLGQQMTALLEVDAPLTEIVNLIRDKLGYYHAHILLVDEESREVVLKEASGPGAAALKAQGLRLKIGQEGIAGWVAHTGETFLCNDVLHEPHYFHAELVPETKAELAVPLRSGNRVIGVLDVQSDRRDAFDKEDVSTLQILGNQVGIAIENARLYQETKHRYEAMIALHETSLDMIARLDTTQLLQALLRRGTQLLGAQGGVVYLYDLPHGLIRAVASYNTSRNWVGVTLKLDEGVIGQVIRTGKPMIINDYHNWSQRAAAFEGSSETRIVGVPLKWENQIIGAFDMVNNPDGRPFNEDDVWLTSLLADLASIAIKNAELHSQIKQFSQELEQKVDARTRELSNAKEEIAARSEQLRLLLAKTIRVQEDERARIARDMHDDVVQLITAARWEVQTAEVFAGAELKDAARDGLLAARELLDQMEKQIRRAIYNLHPPILDAVGLKPALQSYTNQFERIAGTGCRLEIIGKGIRLPIRSESCVYRLVEEALANIATHAHATESSVVLDYRDTTLCITVEDNGCGFDQQAWLHESNRNGSHLGLLSMQERVESLGGSMRVESAPGQGTRLSLQIPIERGVVEWNRSES